MIYICNNIVTHVTYNTNPYQQIDKYALPPAHKLKTAENLAILDEQLSSSNYKNKFHYLLYLEELEHDVTLLEK